MNISNLGRLIGAGLLALGLHAFAPSASAQTSPNASTAERTCTATPPSPTA